MARILGLIQRLGLSDMLWLTLVRNRSGVNGLPSPAAQPWSPLPPFLLVLAEYAIKSRSSRVPQTWFRIQAVISRQLCDLELPFKP